MEFRTLICAAFGFAIAGAVVSAEISDIDYWVPLSFGIIALTFGIGAFGAANDEAESVVLPGLAVVIAAFAIFQGLQGMNDFRELNDELQGVQQQLQDSLDSVPTYTP